MAFCAADNSHLLPPLPIHPSSCRSLFARLICIIPRRHSLCQHKISFSLSRPLLVMTPGENSSQSLSFEFSDVSEKRCCYRVRLVKNKRETQNVCRGRKKSCGEKSVSLWSRSAERGAAAAKRPRCTDAHFDCKPDVISDAIFAATPLAYVRR